MKRDNILFYKNWWETIKTLPKEKQFETVMAIMDYAFNDVMPADAMVSFATAFIREKLDRDTSRYNAICEKRKEGGKRGGLASATKRKLSKTVATSSEQEATRAKETEQEATVATGAKQMVANGSKTYQTEASSTYNDNDNDNDNENENEKINNKLYLQQQDKSCYLCEAQEDDVADDVVEEILVEKFFANNNQASLETLSGGMGCDTETLRAWSESIVAEWKLKGVTHDDYNSAAAHLINVLRRKINDPNERRRNPKIARKGPGVGEWLDNKGRRRYADSDVVVPDNAPPRPSDKHYWSAGKWEDFAI